jgi:hypothetical protein
MMNYLSPLRAIQSLRLRESQLELRWVAEDKQLYELEVPLLEACRLVGFLQDFICPEGRARSNRSHGLIGSVALKGQSKTLAPVQQFKGVSSSDFVALQWEVDSEEGFELKLPRPMALPLLDALEETLPLDRKALENIELHFEKAVSLNNFPVLWKAAYRADRYLEKLPLDSLNQRVADLIANRMRMDDDRKLRPIWFADKNGFYKPDRDIDWLRLLTDAYTELGVRGRLDRNPSPRIETLFAKRLEDESWCVRPDLVRQSAELRGSYARPKVLFKFGRKKWNQQILTGKIRMRPASEFKEDASENPAIRDDELRLSCSDEANILREYRCDDYFVFCVSGVYDYRLYRDFKSDSCLVIKDADEFGRRIRKSAELDLGAKVIGEMNAPVIYVDPFRTNRPELAYEIYFSKHFRYSYQHEFRYVWPPRTELPPTPVVLDIGDSRDIAELIARDSS